MDSQIILKIKQSDLIKGFGLFWCRTCIPGLEVQGYADPWETPFSTRLWVVICCFCRKRGETQQTRDLLSLDFRAIARGAWVHDGVAVMEDEVLMAEFYIFSSFQVSLRPLCKGRERTQFLSSLLQKEPIFLYHKKNPNITVPSSSSLNYFRQDQEQTREASPHKRLAC